MCAVPMWLEARRAGRGLVVFISVEARDHHAARVSRARREVREELGRIRCTPIARDVSRLLPGYL